MGWGLAPSTLGSGTELKSSGSLKKYLLNTSLAQVNHFPLITRKSTEKSVFLSQDRTNFKAPLVEDKQAYSPLHLVCVNVKTGVLPTSRDVPGPHPRL